MIACANGNVHPLLLSGVLLALILPLRHQFCATLHAMFEALHASLLCPTCCCPATSPHMLTLIVCTWLQESMAEDIETSRAALRPWARRAEKQAARARSISPRRSGSRRTPSADLGDQGNLARHTSMGSAGGSGERTINSYLARSSRDGDVPELISQVRRR